MMYLFSVFLSSASSTSSLMWKTLPWKNLPRSPPSHSGTSPSLRLASPLDSSFSDWFSVFTRFGEFSSVVRRCFVFAGFLSLSIFFSTFFFFFATLPSFSWCRFLFLWCLSSSSLPSCSSSSSSAGKNIQIESYRNVDLPCMKIVWLTTSFYRLSFVRKFASKMTRYPAGERMPPA